MSLKKSFLSINKVTGISEEEYANLILDLGCEYIKENVPVGRYNEVVSNRSFWQWYLYEWVELDASFILDVACQAKKYRNDKVYNGANYKFLKFTTAPRLSASVATLLDKPHDPHFADEQIRSTSRKTINKIRTKIVKNGG